MSAESVSCSQQLNLLNAIGNLFGAGPNKASDKPAQRVSSTSESRNLVVSSAGKRVALVIGNSGYPTSALGNPRLARAAGRG